MSEAERIADLVRQLERLSSEEHVIGWARNQGWLPPSEAERMRRQLEEARRERDSAAEISEARLQRAVLLERQNAVLVEALKGIKAHVLKCLRAWCSPEKTLHTTEGRINEALRFAGETP